MGEHDFYQNIILSYFVTAMSGEVGGYSGRGFKLTTSAI